MNKSHREQSSREIHAANCNRLKLSGNFAEASRGENIVEVIQNGVNPRELIKHADCDREENRIPVLIRKNGFRSRRFLQIDRFHKFLELRVGITGTCHFQNASRFFEAALGGEPARTAGDSKQQEQKKKSWCACNAKLPAPLVIAEPHSRNTVI